MNGGQRVAALAVAAAAAAFCFAALVLSRSCAADQALEVERERRKSADFQHCVTAGNDPAICRGDDVRTVRCLPQRSGPEVQR